MFASMLLDFRPGNRFKTAIAITCTCAMLAGCGGGGGKVPNPAEQAKVSGSILKDGKPVKVDSLVTFFCQEKSAMATGKVDAQGKFSLVAADPGVGIPAGRYKVEVRPPLPPVQSTKSADYTKMMSGGAQAAPPADAAAEIATKFQSLETSGIALDVKPGPDNKFELDLAKL